MRMSSGLCQPTEISCNSGAEYFFTCRGSVLHGAGSRQQPCELDEGEELEMAAGDRPAAASSESESWIANVSKRSWRVCHSMRAELMRERLIGLLVEWCETLRAESSCVAYKDACLELLQEDAEHKILRRVPKSPASYWYIPRNLLDRDMEANCAKLCLFYARVLGQQGCVSVLPGCVGQSLYSLRSAIFDPSVWYNEDELRKQVETFARCIWHSHHRPGSAKVLNNCNWTSSNKLCPEMALQVASHTGSPRRCSA